MKTPILQVIGYQDSGKTLFLEQFIQVASSTDYRIGVIKHHGHGEPDLYDDKKDSGRHRNAGAVVTGVSGGGVVSIQAKQAKDWELERLLSLYETFDLDLILVEGYKEKSYPKVVMLRSEDDLDLLKMSNIQAVIIRGEIDTEWKASYRYEEMEKCIHDLWNELKGE